MKGNYEICSEEDLNSREMFFNEDDEGERNKQPTLRHNRLMQQLYRSAYLLLRLCFVTIVGTVDVSTRGRPQYGGGVIWKALVGQMKLMFGRDVTGLGLQVGYTKVDFRRGEERVGMVGGCPSETIVESVGE